MNSSTVLVAATCCSCRLGGMYTDCLVWASCLSDQYSNWSIELVVQATHSLLPKPHMYSSISGDIFQNFLLYTNVIATATVTEGLLLFV